MYSFWERESILKSDIVIIGGGILGLSTACSLKEKNPSLTVTILERNIVPIGASTKNAGFASIGSLTELIASEKKFGTEAMFQLVEKRWRGLAMLDKRLGEQGMKYEHFGGFELLSERELSVHQHIERINKLLFDIFNMDVFNSTPSKIQQFDFNPELVKDIIFNPFDGQIDVGVMMRSLSQYASMLGVNVLYGAKVTSIWSEKDRVSIEVENPFYLQSIFTCSKAAVCTNAFLPNFFPEIKITPTRGHILITEPLAELPFQGIFYSDGGNYYFRNVGNRILIGGGRHLDKESEITTELQENKFISTTLKHKLRTVVLNDKNFLVDTIWQGIMGFYETQLPIISEPRTNTFAALGCNGLGLGISGTVGEELADKLLQ
ncbi:MAG: FAD-binding oxidoreductase [Bacteroidetes bacterium]|nr:FAD-binding oxidoreductase [Bacteroidota bacterium]